MGSTEEKANGATSDVSSKSDDVIETVTTETDISSSIMVSVKETVVSGGADIVEAVEGVNDEGKALIEVNNEESEKEEEGNEDIEKEEEEEDDESEKEEEADDESQNEEDGDEENVVSEEEANEEEGKTEDKGNEGNVGGEQNAEEVDAKPKEGGRKPRRRNKKNKIEQKGSEIVKMDGDKPESSNKKKASKKVQGMGMIFMCSSKTKTDCFRYKLLGLPAGKKDQVQKIYKGMRLFLFDIDLRLMYGIFKAAAPGGYNIEPKAFKSAFPSQVRFTVMEDCLPLAEEKFKKVLKENYYSRNKFDCQLTSEQVKKLCNLFTAAGKTPTSKAAGSRRRKAEGHASVDQGRPKRRAREEDRRPVSRREDRRPVSRKEDRRPVSRREHRYREPRSPPRGLAQLPPPAPAPAPAPVYVYERPLERDSYMRDPVLERRGLRYLDSEPRHRDEIRVPEPYIVYREAPSYRDTAYSTGRALEYAPSATLPVEYRHVNREYQSVAGRSAAYQFPGNLLQSGYHGVEPSTSYYPPSTSLPEYQSRRTIYRY